MEIKQHLYNEKNYINGWKRNNGNDECQLEEKIINIKKKKKGVNIASEKISARTYYIIEHKLILYCEYNNANENNLSLALVLGKRIEDNKVK